MVNSDGTIYVEYEVRNIGDTGITSDTLYLFHIATDNTSGSTVLSTTTQNEAQFPGSIIPDGQGGIIATWTISPSNPPVPQYPYQAVDVIGGAVGTPYNLPFSPTTVSFGNSPTLVLGESGTAFATNGTDTTNGPVVASFNVTSGAVNWSYQASPGTMLSLVATIAGGGVVGKSTTGGVDTVVRFDASGTPTFDNWTVASSLNYFIAGTSWLGFSSAASAPAVYSAAPVELSTSNWYAADGNGGNGANPNLSVTSYSETGPNQVTISHVTQKILVALPNNAQCNNWLQGAGENQGISGLQQMQTVLNENNFGHGVINQYGKVDYVHGAFSGQSNSDHTHVSGVPTNAVFTVNDVGAFFNQFANGDQSTPF